MRFILFLQIMFWAALAYDDNTLDAAQRKILDEVSWSLKLMLIKEFLQPEKTRRVAVEAYVMPGPARQPSPDSNPGVSEDTDMKMKLFRLMYETVRDSDLKVKRAELINSYYMNSSAFEIGYLMGDVTDKFNVMSDIAATLERLYDTWKPIEHINAYEQIANQAIETSHMLELVRAVAKRADSDTTPRRRL